MSFRTIVASALLLAATASVAVAQDDPDRCYTTSDPRCSGDFCGNTFYNPSVTQNWMQTRQAADPGVMQQLAGVYHGEIADPSGRMVNRTYRSYEPNGLWQYQDQTCPPAPPARRIRAPANGPVISCPMVDLPDDPLLRSGARQHLLQPDAQAR